MNIKNIPWLEWSARDKPEIQGEKKEPLGERLLENLRAVTRKSVIALLSELPQNPAHRLLVHIHFQRIWTATLVLWPLK